MNTILFSIFMALCVAYTASQSPYDCPKNSGCFKDPKNCKGNDCKFVGRWTNQGNSTKFEITANFADMITNSTNNTNFWFGIGFSNDGKMPNSSAVICRIANAAPLSVAQYYLFNYSRPGFLANDSAIGLTNSQISAVDSAFTCSFTRLKTLANTPNYADLSKKHYLLLARGPLNANQDLSRHNYRLSSDGSIDFTFSSATLLKFQFLFVCLMAFMSLILF